MEDAAIPYRISIARYSRGNLAVVPLDSRDGFKGRSSYLLDAIGCRWTNRERAYIATPAQRRKFEILFRDGWSASAFGRLTPPQAALPESLRGTLTTVCNRSVRIRGDAAVIIV
ncbi:MAG: hypothetical protein IT428_33620 [Planctomycetaceae bacterium]|nr:hypothetical protein [Planctomycetaceae bacterium]